MGIILQQHELAFRNKKNSLWSCLWKTSSHPIVLRSTNNKCRICRQPINAQRSNLRYLKVALHEAQSWMKKVYDQHHREREFVVGDWVYLRLQPYRQTSISMRRSAKLSPRYYGPFKVLKWIRAIVTSWNCLCSRGFTQFFMYHYWRKKLVKNIIFKMSSLQLTLRLRLFILNHKLFWIVINGKGKYKFLFIGKDFHLLKLLRNILWQCNISFQNLALRTRLIFKGEGVVTCLF